MAQQDPSPQKVDGRAQSDHLQDNDSPKMLNSEMAKAFQEITQGEKTASALESKLDGIHRNLDLLLASFEETGHSGGEAKPSDTSSK